MTDKTYYVQYRIYSNHIHTNHFVECDNYVDAYELLKNVKEYPDFDKPAIRSTHPLRNKYFSSINADILCYSIWCDNGIVMSCIDSYSYVDHMN